MNSDQQAAIRFWDGIAAKYAAKPVDDPEAYERKLIITRALLTPTAEVLDVGCGTGSLAIELAPRVAEVHAVDISAEMVRIGQSKAKAAGLDNVTFHRAELESLPDLGADRFDVVAAYNILHLIPDRLAVLRHMFALLRPGGSFITSTPCLRETWSPLGLVLPIMRLLGKAPPVYLFSKAELEGAVRDAGFVDVEEHWVTDQKTTVFLVARKPE